MTDFLKELEVQMTDAAHRAAAERTPTPRRRPRARPTLALVLAAAAVAIAVIAVMPARHTATTDPAATPATASLKGVRIGAYNSTSINGIASVAARALAAEGAETSVDTVPPQVEHRPSQVYFAKGHGAQARAVMKVLGIDRVGSPLPDLGNGRDQAGRPHDVVVVLGEDFTTPSKRLLDGFAFLRPGTGRKIFTAAGTVRVTTSEEGLCLQSHTSGSWAGTCVDVAEALAGKAIVSVRRPDGRLRATVGLVPDGVDAVVVRRADGTTRRVAVARNVWVTGPDRIVSFTSGSTTIKVP
jgi:hypothetical protein